jgi:hypothetical protein
LDDLSRQRSRETHYRIVAEVAEILLLDGSRRDRSSGDVDLGPRFQQQRRVLR